MRVVCLSDIHGRTDVQVPKGDLLIFAGDATFMGKVDEIQTFLVWFLNLPHTHKVFIAGNHDFFWRTPEKIKTLPFGDAVYLENSGVVVDGIHIWGTPVQPHFNDWAFGENLEDRKKLYDLIPEGLDILVTHSPPAGILDSDAIYGTSHGCSVLYDAVSRKSPRYHIFGHIHGANGKVSVQKTTFINCAVLDDHYNLLHRPKVFDIKRREQ